MTSPRVVAVTGATGFLGRHLVAALAREGARTRILARTGSALEFASDIEVIAGSLDDRAALERLATDADAVVHVAGLVAARNAAAFQRANCDGTRAVAEAVRRHAPEARLVIVSSLAAREPQLSPYAASKRAGEKAADAIYHQTPNNLVIVRPPALYGPGDRGMLALFRAADRSIIPVFGSGRFALLHGADAAATLARLAMGMGDAGKYTLADGNPGGYRMADVLREAGRALGRRPHLLRLPDDVLRAAAAVCMASNALRGRATLFTPGKAREMLHPDWSVRPDELPPSSLHTPRITLAEGFRETVTWYRQAGWLA